jgi:hypothetical protein
MIKTQENERHQIIRSVFQSLDASDPNTAINIRDAFHTVWDQLYELGEHIELAATMFDSKRKRLLLEEHRRLQTMMAILHESYLPVIMPDEEPN